MHDTFPLAPAILCFPGSFDLSQLEVPLLASGVLLSRRSGTTPGLVLDLAHPGWGSASLVALPDAPASPPPFAEVEPELTVAERARLATTRTAATLFVRSRARSREEAAKDQLRYARAALGQAGVGVLDSGSGRIWSPEALAEELAHDAPLDVSSLFSRHLVERPGGGGRLWLHTHGLAEAGGFDLDVLDPSEDLCRADDPGLAVLAASILEGRVAELTEHYELGRPGGAIGLVPVIEFSRSATWDWALEVRDAEDPHHNQDRAVVCEPLAGRARPRPARLFRRPWSRRFGFALPPRFAEVRRQRAQATLEPMLLAGWKGPGSGCRALVEVATGREAATASGRGSTWGELVAVAGRVLRVRSLGGAGGPRKGTGLAVDADQVIGWEVLTPRGRLDPTRRAPAREAGGEERPGR